MNIRNLLSKVLQKMLLDCIMGYVESSIFELDQYWGLKVRISQPLMHVS